MKTRRISFLMLFFAVLMTLSLVGSPVLACGDYPAPTPPPVTITPHPIDPNLVLVIFTNYVSFGAGGATCACSLNLAANIGVVVGSTVVETGTLNVLPGFPPFSPNPITSIGFNDYAPLNPPDQWNGLSTPDDGVGVNIPVGVPIDIVFEVAPFDPASAPEQIANFLAGGQWAIGTGGATPEGYPDHHVIIQPAGPIEIWENPPPDDDGSDPGEPGAI